MSKNDTKELYVPEGEDNKNHEVFYMKTSQFNETTSIGKNGVLTLQETCEGLWNKDKTIHIQCGSPIVVDTLLENMECPNIACPCKIHSQLYRFVKQKNIIEVTSNMIVEFIDEWGIENPLSIFEYSYEEDGLFISSSDKEESMLIEEKLKREYRLDEIADIVLNTKNKILLRKLLDNFDDFESLYEYLDKEGVLGIVQKVQGFEISSRISDMYEAIMRFDEQELRKVCKLVSEDNSDALYETLRESGEGVLKDAITNSIEVLDLAMVSLFKELMKYREMLLEYNK